MQKSIMVSAYQGAYPGNEPASNSQNRLNSLMDEGFRVVSITPLLPAETGQSSSSWAVALVILEK